jgi:hypothetical protein
MNAMPTCFGDYVPNDTDGWCQRECPLKTRKACRRWTLYVGHPLIVWQNVGLRRHVLKNRQKWRTRLGRTEKNAIRR